MIEDELSENYEMFYDENEKFYKVKSIDKTKPISKGVNKNFKHLKPPFEFPANKKLEDLLVSDDFFDEQDEYKDENDNKIKNENSKFYLKKNQGNGAVKLSRVINEQIQTLVLYYGKLLRIANNNEQIETIEGLINQTQILAVTSSRIYRELSGRRPPLQINNAFLPQNFRVAVIKIFKFISTITRNMNMLQRILYIPKIDRQLMIMSATLVSQQRILETL